jgi:NAD(P)-dependent dehydrogenase (short-subunit alcohol dehydrogenase family)
MIRESLAFFQVTPEQAAAGNPIKRINTTDEMAHAVMFLASDDATSLTGMDLDVTGAWLAK